MIVNFKMQLQTLLEQSLKENLPEIDLPSIDLETPADKQHGEFACNIALKSAKVLRKSPLQIAQDLSQSFQKSIDTSPFKDKIAKIEVKNPGFINFFFTPQALNGLLDQIFEQKDDYGRSGFGAGKKVQIEFVSANPTGPLSIAHARQAAVGDALGNILNFLGFQTTKEYYVNDGGNQINILGSSIRLRGLELLGEKVDFPEDAYQGDYIKDMARIYTQQNNITNVADMEKSNPTAFGVEYLMNVIKTDLNDFNVKFDQWSHESEIADQKAIDNVLQLLDKGGHLYEKDGALWFKSSEYGDDKDRVVRKSDGSYTYLTPDIAYHRNKFDRGFKQVINIWGPDHHGYIPRLKAAVEAFGEDKDALKVLIVQLATIFRDGKEVSMSTRKGQFISLREVIDEVGVDAARFFFLMRHISIHLDFDLELAKKQSSENPVYYVQYAHARVFSINRKAEEAGIVGKTSDFSLLKESEELDLIKKLGSFSESLMSCYNELDCYALVNYLQEVATHFHKFYDRCRVVDENKDLAAERLGLCNAARIVLANGLRLLGLSTPESM